MALADGEAANLLEARKCSYLCVKEECSARVV